MDVHVSWGGGTMEGGGRREEVYRVPLRTVSCRFVGFLLYTWTRVCFSYVKCREESRDFGFVLSCFRALQSLYISCAYIVPVALLESKTSIPIISAISCH